VNCDIVSYTEQHLDDAVLCLDSYWATSSSSPCLAPKPKATASTPMSCLLWDRDVITLAVRRWTW
jgi:hypothetical protein